MVSIFMNVCGLDQIPLWQVSMAPSFLKPVAPRPGQAAPSIAFGRETAGGKLGIASDKSPPAKAGSLRKSSPMVRKR